MRAVRDRLLDEAAVELHLPGPGLRRSTGVTCTAGRRAEVVRGLARIVAVGAPALALWAVSGLPFGLSPIGLKDFYSKASNGYKTTSVWAFNLWGVIGFQRGDVRARARASCSTSPASRPSTWVRSRSSPATAYVIWRAHRSINRGHDEARVLVASAAMTSLIAFTLLTRMHERYLFPVLACLAPLVLWRGFRRIYAAVSALFVLNLWYPFAVYNRSWKRRTGVLRKLTTFYTCLRSAGCSGTSTTTDTWQKKMWSLFMVACLRRARRTRLPVDRAGRRRTGAARRVAAREPDGDGLRPASRAGRVDAEPLAGAARRVRAAGHSAVAPHPAQGDRPRDGRGDRALEALAAAPPARRWCSWRACSTS